MSDALTTSKEDWDRFFHLDNQDSLLESVSPVHSKSNDFDTSPSVPSLDYTLHSAGTSSPSEPDNFASQFSPVYTIPAPAAQSTPTIRAPNAKKRKLATDNAAPQPPAMGRQPRGQKISHNVIEKRYRSNLNDKIARLRDSVPELRTAAPTVKRRTGKAAAASDSDGSGGEDGGQGLKFNKATVLTKATEYILQLERQNQKLASELSQLRNRSGPVEKLRNPPAITTAFSSEHAASSSLSCGVPELTVTPGSPGDATPRAPASPTAAGLIRVPDEVRRLREQASPGEHYAASITGVEDGSEADAFNQPIQGMIGLPDDLRRLRDQAAAQDHFAPESSYYSAHVLANQEEFAEVESEQTAWPRSKVLSRVLVGSLAALMVMEGMSEPDQSSQQNEKRGLFSLPTELVTESRGFRAQIRQRIINFAASPVSGKMLPVLAFSAVFFIFCFLTFVRMAPKGSKSVREGPPAEPSSPGTMSMASTPSTPSPPPIRRTYSPPPNAPLEPASRSWDFDLIDRLTTEWFGTSLRVRHRDEEAFWRRPRGRLWSNMREGLPRLLYERRPG